MVRADSALHYAITTTCMVLCSSDKQTSLFLFLASTLEVVAAKSANKVNKPSFFSF